MTDIYRFDPSQARFTIQAFASGLLATLGHSPTFTVRDFSGEMRFEDGQIHGLALDLNVKAESLDLQDKVSAADRLEIQTRMFRDVLEAASFPEIVYQAADVPSQPVSRSEHRLRLNGQLTLHGVTRMQPIAAILRTSADGARLSGECSLRLSDYRIKPVTALGGAIKLKDELRVAFDLPVQPETK